jgi:DNA (cytosine-5)-methyltransferase 3A
MNVLSLFDGISGAMQALKELDIKVENYFSSEIDKYAIKISNKNHPEVIQLGDVHLITKEILPKIDLIIGGFPCQDLSIAKRNRKGLKGSRSGLFYECIRLLKELKPKYFLFENVASMNKQDKEIISQELGVEPVMINSSLLTAQSRKRLYWTNIPNIKQPEDKGIMLKDILIEGITERDKSLCVTATYGSACCRDYFEKSSRQLVFQNKPRRVGHFNKGGQGDRIYSVDSKSVCLSANGGGRGAKTGLYACALRSWPRYKNKNQKRIKRLEKRKDKKANCLTTVTSDSLLSDNYIVRKLHPIECERLQGFPDNYTEGVSNTQRYKALGNSFTVPVIKHILKLITEYEE